MGEQTFMFCVGATKAGTSWLFDHLYSHTDAQLRAVKELHYFDAQDGDNTGWQKKQHQAALAAAQADIGIGKAGEYKRALVQDLEEWIPICDGQGNAQVSDAAYLDYVTKGAGDARLVGDITPAYGLLSEEMLSRMAALTDKVRFVYLMRDPVDRIWSNIRMVAGAQGKAALEHKVECVLNGAATNIIERSNYRRTLNRLSRAVPTGALHIEYYERLFTPDAIERLSAFLGITPAQAQFDRVVHKSPQADLTDDMRGKLKSALNPQYNFVEKFMGELPDEWTQKMVNL